MAGRPKDDALPRGAERLLRLALEGEVAEAVLGDLEEGWRRRKERPGARRWLARQVVGSVWAGVRERWVALVACWIPARRAARVDPVVALRAE